MMAATTGRPEKEVIREFAEQKLKLHSGQAGTISSTKTSLPAKEKMIHGSANQYSLSKRNHRPPGRTVLDWTVAPFSTSAGLYIVSGSASYAVEISFDSEDAIAAGTDRWFETGLGQWQTASAFTAIQSPATFARVNFNAATTGPCEFKLVAGLPN